MCYINLLILSILFLISTSCQHSAKITSSTDRSNSFLCDYSSEELDNHSTAFDNNLIYLSTFNDIPKKHHLDFLKKRHNSFIKLFSNDFEPYTQKYIERSMCLFQVKMDYVYFLSGEPIFWANCAKANPVFKSALPGLRYWKIYGNTVFEITVLGKTDTTLSDLIITADKFSTKLEKCYSNFSH